MLRVPREHAAERAAGDAASTLAARRRASTAGRADCAEAKAELVGWVQHRVGAVEGPAGQAGVHPEGQREAAPTRDSGDRRPGHCRPGSSTRWSRSGRRGSSRDRTGSGRAVAATTRSRRSTGRCKGQRPSGCGCSTRTWRRRSTASTTTISSTSSARSPPGKMVARWLKAGVVERGRFTPTEEGTPQGGVISPLLLNIALHGMEEAAGVRYLTGTHVGHTAPDSPVLVQIRRRLRRHVSHPGAGRTGQGAAGRLAGAEGPGLQRGQDAHRPPRPTGSTSWGSTSAATPTASCSSNPARRR